MRICKWYNVCPIKYYTDNGLLEKRWVETYCKKDWEKCIRYKMEEAGKYHPDWMLPDGTIDLRLKNR